MSSSQQALTTFTPFPKLPSELRRMIWKYALPSSRRIEVGFPFTWLPSSTSESTFEFPRSFHSANMACDNITIASMSLACHESKVEANRLTKLPILQGTEASNNIHFDPKADILCFNFDCEGYQAFMHLMRALPAGFDSQLRRLSIKYSNIRRMSFILLHFTAVEELIVEFDDTHAMVDLLNCSETVDYYQSPTYFHNELSPTTIDRLVEIDPEDNDDDDESTDDDDSDDQDDTRSKDDGRKTFKLITSTDNDVFEKTAGRLQYIFGDLSKRIWNYKPPPVVRIASAI